MAGSLPEENTKWRRRRNRWRWLALLLAVVLVTKYSKHSDNNKLGPHVAEININNVIIDDQYRLDSLSEINDNDDIRAVLMHVNSPGGLITAGEKLYHEFKQIADNKPLVCVFESVAASAGYLISLPCHHIIAHETSEVGSIGVLVAYPEVADLFEKLGIKYNVVRSGFYKAKPTPYEATSPEVTKLLQAHVDDGREYFVGKVLEHRKQIDKSNKAIFDGRTFSGGKALTSKLVDAVGFRNHAVDWLKEQHQLDVKFIGYTLEKPKTPFEKFEDELGSYIKTQILQVLYASTSYLF
ncbi:MAG: signal peptide peptidase SppA [Pseudomonadota bacterium]